MEFTTDFPLILKNSAQKKMKCPSKPLVQVYLLDDLIPAFKSLSVHS